MDHIKEHWQKQAIEHGTSPLASWGDKFALELEYETLRGFIAKVAPATVLDAGCANAHAMRRHMADNPRAEFLGLDYCAEMVKAARQHVGVHAVIGDVRNLSRFTDKAFDLAYTTRTLINLPTWADQLQALNELARVANIVVIMEAFYEPLQKLNALRAVADLPPLVEHDFNRYLKLSRVFDWLNASGYIFQHHPFSGAYYLGSRFMRELVTNANHVNVKDYDGNFNQSFYELEKGVDVEQFGIQQAISFRTV